jgi:hypothetical protein
VIVCSDEVGYFMASMKGEANSNEPASYLDKAVLASNWEGAEWARELVNSHRKKETEATPDTEEVQRPSHMPRTNISMVSWVQPVLMLRRVTEPDYLGMWARFDFAMVKRRHVKFDSIPPPPETVKVQDVVNRVYEWHALEPRVYLIESDALAAFRELAQTNEDELSMLDGKQKRSLKNIANL